MDTTEKIILVILASALALFLILAIAAVVGVIRLIKHINRIADRAEQFVSSAEAVGTIFRKSAEQMSLIRLIRNMAEHVGHHKSTNKGEKNE